MMMSYCSSNAKTALGINGTSPIRFVLKIVPVNVITIKWGDKLYGPH